MSAVHMTLKTGIPKHQKFCLPFASTLYWHDYDGDMLVFVNGSKQAAVPVEELLNFLKGYIKQ